jgi:hypothetical protein
MAFHHQADERFRAARALLNDAAPDFLLLGKFLFRVRVAAIHHQHRRQFFGGNLASAALMLAAS